MSSFAEALPQLVWIADRDGRIVYVNERWVEYTGLDAEEVATDGASVFHPDDRKDAVHAWRASLAAGSAFDVECRIRRAIDHTYRWFVLRAAPARDEDGGVERWIGTATDIDPQKRANDHLRFLLDATAQFSPPLAEREIAQRLADLAVQRNAEWSIVYLGEPDRLEAAASAHRDPARRDTIASYRATALPGIDEDLAHAIRANRTVLYSTLEPNNGAEHPAMNSAMIVPLPSDRGDVLGAALFVSSWRRYEQSDIEIAAAVTGRAGLALQNARVIERERRTSELLRFVARAGELLFEDFDVSASFERLCHFAVAEIADVSLIVEWVEGKGMRIRCASGKTMELDYHAGAISGERAARPDLEQALLDRLRPGAAYLTREFDTERIVPRLWEYVAPHVRAMEIRSAITIPIAMRGTVHGAVILASCGLAPAFTTSDLPAFGELGRTAAIAVSRSESFARERRIANALQHAMLPRGEGLPQFDDLRLNAIYRPSSDDADIGGDWYDALELDDDRVMITVGDVTGRGLEAAGLMGQLRQSFRAVATYERDPARMLDAVDRIARGQSAPSIATAFVAVVDRTRRTIRYANAGHPYGLLKRKDEVVELRSFGLPLGLRDGEASDETRELAIDDADLLVLYTDGLVESTHDILAGERRLFDVVRSEAVRAVRNPAEFICSACVGTYAPDDTAVLTATFGGARIWSFDADNAQAAHDARGEFISYLRAQASDGDLMAAELIFGELIGNVVRHAPGPIEIQLAWNGERPVLHVTDRGPGFDRTPALPDDMLKESGRGLFIIETLSESLNVEHVTGYGTHVSATLPVVRA